MTGRCWAYRGTVTQRRVISQGRRARQAKSRPRLSLLRKCAPDYHNSHGGDVLLKKCVGWGKPTNHTQNQDTPGTQEHTPMATQDTPGTHATHGKPPNTVHNIGKPNAYDTVYTARSLPQSPHGFPASSAPSSGPSPSQCATSWALSSSLLMLYGCDMTLTSFFQPCNFRFR